jgi:hypothetical protein
MGKLGSFLDALAEDSPELSVTPAVGEGSETPPAVSVSGVPVEEAEHPEKAAATDGMGDAVTGVEVRTPSAKAGPAKVETESKPDSSRRPRKPAAKNGSKQQEAPEATVADRARWQSLHRKEVRMHPHQADELKILTMRVNRGGPSDPGERVTDNTIIRVALALLLEQRKHELRGRTEDELRASVGLPPLPPLDY